jgi:hypothetical protein
MNTIRWIFNKKNQDGEDIRVGRKSCWRPRQMIVWDFSDFLDWPLENHNQHMAEKFRRIFHQLVLKLRTVKTPIKGKIL